MTDEKTQIYNGVPMPATWVEEIIHSQSRPTTVVNGVMHQRVRFKGHSPSVAPWPDVCDQCGVLKGQIHVMGCDFEECPVCGGEFLYCACANEENR